MNDTLTKETTTRHSTGTRQEWLTKRLELLKAEKELTRRSDELARRRQELPWVRVAKAYRFDTGEGKAVSHRPVSASRALSARSSSGQGWF